MNADWGLKTTAAMRDKISSSTKPVLLMDHLDAVKKVLAGVDIAYVFGSYAKKTQDEYSDLDLLIVKNTKKDFFYRFQEFPGLYELGVPVDLLVYTPDEFAQMQADHNPLIEDIVQNGIRII